MSFIVNEKPCLLLEAAELVYAMVNRIPVEALTQEAPYCIPAAEVGKIQETVCAGLNPEDEELQFYFKGVPVESRSNRMSCLASALLYSNAPIDFYESEDALEYLHSAWFNHRRPFSVTSISGFSVGIGESEQYTNLTHEITKLPVPQLYQTQLVEVFSGYDWHLNRVGDILKPVTERLKPLLQPWVEKATPLREEWIRYGKLPGSMDSLRRRLCLENDDIRELHITLRYFSPLAGPSKLTGHTNMLRIHAGVSLLPGQDTPETDDSLKDWEYAAFRLISGPDRVAILRATKNSPKCIQDLSQELGRNPGSIFRDLNSLYNVGLLTLNIISGRNYYTANLSQMKKLTDRLLRHLDE